MCICDRHTRLLSALKTTPTLISLSLSLLQASANQPAILHHAQPKPKAITWMAKSTPNGHQFSAPTQTTIKPTTCQCNGFSFVVVLRTSCARSLQLLAGIFNKTYIEHFACVQIKVQQTNQRGSFSAAFASLCVRVVRVKCCKVIKVEERIGGVYSAVHNQTHLSVFHLHIISYSH